MQCLFYVHGTPNGQNIWGADENREYIKSFYGGDQEESIRFVIEIFPQKQRTYFTYLRCKNVFGKNNRAGAYFGITLGVDSLVYCKDTRNLYNLFDQIYAKCIANGSILTKQHTNEIFQVSSFAEKATELEKVKQLFISKFTESFIEKRDICTIDSNSLTITKSTAIEKYNLAEVDNEAFRAVLQNSLKVYVSPDYPTKDTIIDRLYQQINPEREKSKRLSEEYGKLQEQSQNLSNEVTVLRQKTDELTKTEQQLRGSLQDRDRRISDLERKNQELVSNLEQKNRELEKERTKKRLDDIIGRIYPDIQSLQKTMRKVVPQTNYEERKSEQQHENISLITLISIGLSLLSFLLLVFVSIVLLRATKQNVTKTTTTAAVVLQSEPIVRFNVPNNCIIEKDSTYIAFVQNCPQGTRTEWRVDGFDIVSGSKPDDRISVRATDKDTAILSLYCNNEKKYAKRCIVNK